MYNGIALIVVKRFVINQIQMHSKGFLKEIRRQLICK